ncbi:MAG: 4-(cytidine 5'-diphospho)-2-C-methyl-D-erythritol kinase [Candidatus Paracaedibacteraceae bacterium]|nr:4-(cytidine 5'-diphospho)-2-C-methyl-D-erythritol kinase [Candidatus Paracaedibacteraceae bacterium]
MKLTAHAKVNLMLHVTGKDEDGYHHLQSVFAFTQFGDDIVMEPASTTTIEFNGEFATALESGKDSVSQALIWYFDHFKLASRSYRVEVTKNIPIAAGLGGGTSDAATVLAYLFWQDYPQATAALCWEFVKASGKLGADVPVSLAFHLGLGQVFWVEGSGREGNCQPLKVKGLARHFVLANPGVPLSTAEVFANLGGRFDPPLSSPEILTSDFLLHTHNVLQAAALKLVPDLAKLFMMFMLDRSFSYFRLSGSGASCFAVYKDRRRAEAVFQKLKENNRGWWVKKTEILWK